MDRRSFIKLTAMTGTSATLASCGNPEHAVIRFVPDDDLTPGLAEWKPSVCTMCGAGCGLSVRVMDADAEVMRDGQTGLMRVKAAKKLEGNADHPVNQGKLCARGQAGVQVTYHPDRITQPMRRSGARFTGELKPISWDEALTDLITHLDALAAGGKQRGLACWMRPRTGLRGDLVAQILKRFGAPPPVTYELFADTVLRRANLASFGREQLPTFDLARARFVISFGADFLGTWNSPVAQNVAYGQMRQARPGLRGKFVQVEARMSQTGANADEWVPVKPGTEGVLALGLAHLLMTEGGHAASSAGAAGALVDGWSGGLTAFTPDAVEKTTGVAAARVQRLAREIAEMSPAVAIIGGAPLAHTNGFSQAVAVNALNALLGAVGAPGGVSFTPQPSFAAIEKELRPAGAAPSFQDAVAEMLRTPDSVQALFVDHVNPVFAAPPGWRVRQALERVPYIVSFGSFVDETSALADLILPDHSSLESWVATVPESGASGGVISVAAPAVRPLHQTRATPDVLLETGRRLAKPLAPALPWQTFDEMVQAALGDNAATAQQQGGLWGDAVRVPASTRTASGAAKKVTVVDPQFDGAQGQYPFHLLPYASSNFLDGSLAHLPWLQELPDPMTSSMWSTWIELNPATAERLGVAQGDIVEVKSQHGSVRAPAFVWPGIAPDLVAMPVGQGHRTFTRYASNRGANPVDVLAPLADAETGALAWAATRVQISRVGETDGSLILFAGEMREQTHRR